MSPNVLLSTVTLFVISYHVKLNILILLIKCCVNAFKTISWNLTTSIANSKMLLFMSSQWAHFHWSMQQYYTLFCKSFGSLNGFHTDSFYETFGYSLEIPKKSSTRTIIFSLIHSVMLTFSIKVYRVYWIFIRWICSLEIGYLK